MFVNDKSWLRTNKWSLYQCWVSREDNSLWFDVKYMPVRRGVWGCVRTSLAELIISKSCRFSPETEFTPLILASLASKSAPPFVKPLNSQPLFKSLRTGLK